MTGMTDAATTSPSPLALRYLPCLPTLLPPSDEMPTEEPRNPCKLKEDRQYSSFDLNDIATCFTMCKGSADSPCDVGNLQR